MVLPTGLVVRAIAPLLQDKTTDPAVVCLDEKGQFVIPLVGGHVGGANALARRVAALTGGIAAITTASDGQGKPALDLLAQEYGWHLAPNSQLTPLIAALVNDDPVGILVDPDLPIHLRDSFISRFSACPNANVLPWNTLPANLAGLVVVTHRRYTPLLDVPTVIYHPPVLYVGIGCRRGTPVTALRQALLAVFEEAGLALESVAAIVSAEIKAHEPGLQALARELDVPLQTVTTDALRAVPTALLSPSAAQEHFGVPGVAEPAALVASRGRLLVPKRVFEQCTVAVAIKEDAGKA